MTATIEDLLGNHPRVIDRRLSLRLDELLARTHHFRTERVPAFRAYQKTRNDLIASQEKRLGLADLKPRTMSAFVRNRLVDEVYLPLIGDNLAKQLGATGDGKRTDQMGLLLLISPPGYGKTTLMEYVADRLGLAFVRVDGPALGHDVTSLDPTQAPNATAAREVEKINLALEMGNNVLLYVDDIQHTSPELLQKFIPSATLSAASRSDPHLRLARQALRRLHGRQPVHRIRAALPHPRHARQSRGRVEPGRRPFR